MQKVINEKIKASFKNYQLPNGITLSVKILKGEKTGKSNPQRRVLHGPWFYDT